MQKNKCYTYPTETKAEYTITLLKDKQLKETNKIIFDVIVQPPLGHFLTLRNIIYNNNKISLLSQGDGFHLSISQTLKRRLLMIGKDIQRKYAMRIRSVIFDEKKESPRILTRQSTQDIKNKILKSQEE